MTLLKIDNFLYLFSNFFNSHILNFSILVLYLMENNLNYKIAMIVFRIIMLNMTLDLDYLFYS